MKKLLSVMLSVLIMMSCALAAELPDLSAYTEEELLQLQSNVSAEISKRSGAKNVEVPSGDYIVGEDFPEGTYTITASKYSIVGVYQNEEDMQVVKTKGEDYGKVVIRSKSYMLKEGETVAKIKLEKGNAFSISMGAVTLAPYAGLKIN